MSILAKAWMYISVLLMIAPFILFWTLPEIRLWLLCLMVTSFIAGFLMLKYTPEKLDKIIEQANKAVSKENGKPQ